MESNNPSPATSSSHNTVTSASSSEGCTSQTMLPDQRNDDKGKQTCSRREKLGPSNNQRLKTAKFLGDRGDTGRYEAFLYAGKEKKSPAQVVYLGRFDNGEDAAKARDLCAIKTWGESTRTNFPPSKYEKESLEVKDMSREECLAAIRMTSPGGKEKMLARKVLPVNRGVRRIREGRWQAMLHKGKGTRKLYVGTFETEEEAARAHDIATIRLKGPVAARNLNLRWKSDDIESIVKSSKIPIGKGASEMIKARTADETLLHITDEPTSTTTTSSEQYRPSRKPDGGDRIAKRLCIADPDNTDLKLAPDWVF